MNFLLRFAKGRMAMQEKKKDKREEVREEVRDFVSGWL